MLLTSQKIHTKKKKKKNLQVLVDDVECLFHIMWGKNLFCEYVVSDFY